MRLLALSLGAALALAFARAPQGNVYICTGPNAEVYHYTRTCRGLNACKHDVVGVPKERAVELGRRLCGWED